MSEDTPRGPATPHPVPDGTWGSARPRTLPRPTSAPALCAAAVVLLFWSVVTSPILAGFGGALFIVSFVIWVKEVTDERRTGRTGHDA